ncbi:MAG: diaminopimelate epimerase [Myxococcota bacterium]
MSHIAFAKYEGLGNDFIIIDGAKAWLTPEGARRVCDRRRGIGADGVLTLLPSRHPEAEVRMHVLNADGSVAEMCGNGLRCVVQHHLNQQRAERTVVDTDAGLLAGARVQDAVRIDMGAATLVEPSVPVSVDGTTVEATVVSMGNPHLVLRPFEKDADLMSLAQTYGPALERDPRFPDRINVGFASVVADRVKLVVFERGSGITQACGTGASAAVAALFRGEFIDAPRAQVELPGGRLTIELADAPASGGRLGAVVMTGPARHVFDGTIEVAPTEVREASAALQRV